MLTPAKDEQRRRVTVEQLEQEFARPETSSRFLDNWLQFRAAVRAEDELWEHCSPLDAWKQFAGSQSIQMVRNGTVVRELVIARS